MKETNLDYGDFDAPKTGEKYGGNDGNPKTSVDSLLSAHFQEKQKENGGDSGVTDTAGDDEPFSLVASVGEEESV